MRNQRDWQIDQSAQWVALWATTKIPHVCFEKANIINHSRKNVMHFSKHFTHLIRYEHHYLLIPCSHLYTNDLQWLKLGFSPLHCTNPFVDSFSPCCSSFSEKSISRDYSLVQKQSTLRCAHILILFTTYTTSKYMLVTLYDQYANGFIWQVN